MSVQRQDRVGIWVAAVGISLSYSFIFVKIVLLLIGLLNCSNAVIQILQIVTLSIRTYGMNFSHC